MDDSFNYDLDDQVYYNFYNPNHIDPYRYVVSSNPEQAIPTHLILPSYTEVDFQEPQTIYIKKGYKLGKEGYVKRTTYNYSDRLVEIYGFEKDMASRIAVDDTLPVWSPAAIEQYLRNVSDNPDLELVHIQSGVNLSTLSPYHIYGYIEHK